MDSSRKPEKSFVPEYRGPIEGWVTNYLKKNYWRVRHSMEYEDISSESFLIFLEVKSRYSSIDNPKWFMSMFQKVFINRFYELCKKDSDIRSIPNFTEFEKSSDDDFQSIIENTVSTEHIDAQLQVALKQAPEEVKQVLRLLLNVPSEVLYSVSEAWKERGKKKEMGNQMLCSMIGLDPEKNDLVQSVRNYFLNC